MALHSNALNFLSFVQGSVDPRTGQYAVSIDLPELNPNTLCGPDLPLQLNFNPMNEQNAGFGIGWNLKLTRFTVSSGMLDLYTGESFRVADNGPGETAVVAERKLESFQFSNISEGEQKRFRIAHKSGLTEILEPRGSDYDLAVPVRVLAPSGHGIDLSYVTVNSKPRLASISDDSKRVLLKIDYSSNAEVPIDLNPDTEVHARFTLGLQGDKLEKVTLPGPEKAAWQFTYQTYGPLHYLTRLDNPIGGVETVRYKEDGHAFPGVARTLPYAIEHILQPDPLDESTHLKNTYDYTSNNFLGNGAGVTWTDEGDDNLYKSTSTSFTYGSTASHYLDDQVLRTVQRSFNRFHLLTEQVITQQGCIETSTTTYHEVANRTFAEQPNHFQLPHKVTKTWTLAGNSRDRHDETLETLYDTWGNLIEEIQANGMRTVREYYPKAASDGCPADPEGFVRNLKCETIYPAPVEDDSLVPAPIKRNRYRYVQLPGLTQAITTLLPVSWLALEQEDTFEVTLEQRHNGPAEEQERLLHSNHRSYLNMPDKPHLHGRNDLHEFSMNGFSASSRWRYELIKDTADKLTWLQTREIYKAPGGTLERATRTVHSIHSGQLLEDQDINGVVTRHRYDVFDRLIEQTTAPDDPTYKATRRYAYPLLSEERRTRSCDEVTDAKGVVTRVVYDGQNRPIREEREVSVADDPKKRVTRTVSASRYDSAGRLVAETFYDYPPDEAPALAQEEPDITTTYTYGYDGWGARNEVNRPDGVTEYTHATPFGEGGDLVTSWIESPDQPDVRQQVRVSQLNVFNKPIFEYRQIEAGDNPPVQAGRTDYVYDGLGRCIKDTLSFTIPSTRAVSRTREYLYDIWGRMTETVRADGSALLRSFAPHSLGELTTLLQVRKAGSETAETVCERIFDGLDRLEKLKVGPRVEEYAYIAETMMVEKRTAYSLEKTGKGTRKRVIDYQYLPQLTQQPTELKASIEEEEQIRASTEASFGYDPMTADISSAGNGNGQRQYLYTDQGYLSGETWKVANKEQYHSNYRHSFQGQMRNRKHSDGLECVYGYDDLGRVISISQGALHSTLDYNSEGLLCSTRTHDSGNADRYVLCTQTYDALGREKDRTLSVNGNQEQVLSVVWQDNDLLYSRTLVRDGKEVRKETFEYDELDRLVEHTCTGEALPCNAKGRPISNQLFRFDEFDNLTRCQTEFADGEADRADFTYKSDGSFQLEKVTHRLLEDYPAEQAFEYDDQGNMLNDELGRALEYDTLGRLQRVVDLDGKTPLVEYQYDGHDQLVASLHAGNRQVHRRFLGHQLDSTLENDVLTQYLYGGSQPLGVQQYPADAKATQLLLSDPAGSVISESDVDGTRHATYSAYGERPEDNGMRSLLAFNGEAREEALGWYLLGSGYRAYNPGLMRFHSPDSMSPEEAGINPYLYALGNPVNWRDPTGHRAEGASTRRDPPSYIDPPEDPETPLGAWIGVAGAALMLAVSVYFMPWTAPAAIGITKAYIMGVVGVAANAGALGIQAYAVITKSDDPNLSYIGYGFSVVGGFIGGPAIAAVRTQLATRANYVLKMRGVISDIARYGKIGKVAKAATPLPGVNATTRAAAKAATASPRATLVDIGVQTSRPGSPAPAIAGPSRRVTFDPTLDSNTPPGSSGGSVSSSGSSSSGGPVQEPAPKVNVIQSSTGATPPPQQFRLDLTLLSENNQFTLQNDKGRYITAPPKK